MLLQVIFCITHSAIEAIMRITEHEYPLMDGIKHVSDELFPTGPPLAIVLPSVEEDSTKTEVDYLIKELQTSSRWPIILTNLTYEMNVYMGIELNQFGSYVILISGNCHQFTNYINNIRKQLLGFTGSALWQTWKARAWFVIAVMTPCKHYDNTIISKAIFGVLWTGKVTNIVVVFKETSGYVSNFHQQETSDSEPQVFFSLHTWFPYENSQSCNPFEGNVPLHTFLIRNFSDIEYTRKLRKVPVKNFHGCRFDLFAVQSPPYVQPPKRTYNNDSRMYEYIYQEGFEIQVIKMISKSLNISFFAQREPIVWDYDGEQFKQREFIFWEAVNSKADVMIGGFNEIHLVSNYLEFSHSYYNIRMYWITPSAIKYHSWARIFKTFPRDIWIVVILLLVFAVTSVHFIIFYGQKLHLNEHRTYQNVPNITSNITAILLGVSVATQPRTAPLRVFFGSWVWYSVAISTVFQAFFTTFIIEPGYEEPIKNMDQLFKSGRKFGSPFEVKEFNRTIKCPGDFSCASWAIKYQNITTITFDVLNDNFKGHGLLTDKYNRPVISEIEDGNMGYLRKVIYLSKGHFFLEYINKFIDHIVEAGLLTKLNHLLLENQETNLKGDLSHTFADSYVNMNVTHLQPAFYVLLLGYFLSLLCFVFEIVWYRLISKIRYITHISAPNGAI